MVKKSGVTKSSVLRFAHPFFTDQKVEDRPLFKGNRRMQDSIEDHLLPIPPVKGDSTMTLADIVGPSGAKDIEGTGELKFHAVGDTGHENGDAQEFVASAMAKDFKDVSTPEKCPAFFLHLGDVIYYDNTDRGYHAQFYAPYKTYPGKIIGVPGNHDGELFKWNGKPTGQAKTLEAFQKNFCLPPASTTVTSGTILRQMVAQPGVYWKLECPFIDIIGLYSNMAENPGFIGAAKIGYEQPKWLTKILSGVAKERAAGQRKALVFAVHHPPYSNGAHGSSTQMLKDIDECCDKAGVIPDAVLAAHSHDYQRYTRFVKSGSKKIEIPFIVAGVGGRGLSTKLAPADGKTTGDRRYDKAYLGYGFLRTTVNKDQLKFEFNQVDATSGKSKKYDQVIVDLKTRTVTT